MHFEVAPLTKSKQDHMSKAERRFFGKPFVIVIIVQNAHEFTAVLATIESILRVDRSGVSKQQKRATHAATAALPAVEVVWVMDGGRFGRSEACLDHPEIEKHKDRMLKEGRTFTLRVVNNVRRTTPFDVVPGSSSSSAVFVAAALQDFEAERAVAEARAVFSQRRVSLVLHPGCMVMASTWKILARMGVDQTAARSRIRERDAGGRSRRTKVSSSLLHIWETHEYISPFDRAWASAVDQSSSSSVGPLVGCRAQEMCVVDTTSCTDFRLRHLEARAIRTIRQIAASRDDTRSCHPRDCIRMVLCKETHVVGKRSFIVDAQSHPRASLMIAPRRRVALCVHGDMSLDGMRTWKGVCENAPCSRPGILKHEELSSLPPIFEKVSKQQQQQEYKKRLPDSLAILFRRLSSTQKHKLMRTLPLLILGIVVAFAMLLHRNAIACYDHEFFTSSSCTNVQRQIRGTRGRPRRKGLVRP